MDSLPVQWQFCEETGELFGAPASGADAGRLDALALRQSLQQAGYDNLRLEDGSLEALLEQLAAAAPKRVLIAQRTDAQANIHVSDDAMCAFLATTPSFGGQELDEQRLRAAVTAAGIDWSLCDRAAIDQALTRKSVSDLVLARGVPMEPGEDGRFVPLVEGLRAVPLTEDATGRVNFREMLEFIAVEPGTPLMRLEPPTPGKEGADVHGRVIPAAPGNARSFPHSVPGAAVDPADPSLLIAEIAGHPLVLEDCVQVDDVLELNAVDVATGNVDFDGSVLVKGDVAAGSTLRASGDIVVKGIVDRATLTAGNDITISGGVFGEQTRDQDAQARPARLIAGGDISANFVTASFVSAGKVIHVREYAAHSDLRGKLGIHLGQAGGKGRLIGGRCRSDREILANVIGTDANVPTEIVVGYRHRLRSRHDALRRELEARLERQEDVAHTSKRLLSTRRRIDAAQDARIVVKQRVFPNTLLTINAHTLKISTEHSGARYICGASAVQRLAL